MTKVGRLMELPAWQFNLLPEEAKQALLPLDQAYFQNSNGVGKVRVIDVSSRDTIQNKAVSPAKKRHQANFRRFTDRN